MALRLSYALRLKTVHLLFLFLPEDIERSANLNLQMRVCE
jgi:hypothetical protein